MNGPLPQNQLERRDARYAVRPLQARCSQLPRSASLERARLDRLAKEAAARPFFVAGSFDRSTIMSTAIASARLQRAKGNQASWSQLLSSALKFAWICARQQRAFATH